MLHRGTVLVLMAVVGVLIVGCETTQKTSSSSTGVKPRMDTPRVDARTTAVAIAAHYRGNDAGFTQPGVFLINSQQELEKRGSTELINKSVDFENQTIVVLALGEQKSGGYWAHIDAVQNLGERLYVQGFANQPAVDEMTTQQITHPYAAAVVPKIFAVVQPEITSVRGQPMP